MFNDTEGFIQSSWKLPSALLFSEMQSTVQFFRTYLQLNSNEIYTWKICFEMDIFFWWIQSCERTWNIATLYAALCFPQCSVLYASRIACHNRWLGERVYAGYIWKYLQEFRSKIIKAKWALWSTACFFLDLVDKCFSVSVSVTSESSKAGQHNSAVFNTNLDFVFAGICEWIWLNMDPGGGSLGLQAQESKMPHTMIMQDFGKHFIY